ncbi:MAG TPA: polymer-forming cytoskeletal protein [Gracilimonas sp.]|uniref:bactofilin family protein n=1 Tax=Gracilimonas sp. TaxID=1974203 RepID=UPI002DAD9AA6|nr:polymer-forming cytoskeletal protein [Gracilimonas sp.]
MKLKRKQTPVNTQQNPQSPAITYITESTEIKADIKCDDDMRIAGLIDGEVQSKKKVIVTDSGKIKGTLYSPDADISGKVTGDIYASQSLVLRGSAIVQGKIMTKKLTIENGAQLKGDFQVGPNVNVDTKDSKKASDSGSASASGSSSSSTFSNPFKKDKKEDDKDVEDSKSDQASKDKDASNTSKKSAS